MAYKAHAWVNGELITAEKLNALEAGAAQALAKLATDADLPTVTAKVNELIDVLMKRGICSGGE